MSGPGPGYKEKPEHKVEYEKSPRRVRVEFAGETVADSTDVLLLRESKHVPVYYFPRDDVRMDKMERTDHTTHCPFKGDASYFSVNVGNSRAENAVWSYEDPYDEVPGIKDYLAFYWNKMDHWYEEDDEVFVHARDPYKRVDVVKSYRPVKVVLNGKTVAESRDSMFLFETGLPTRYYLPKEAVDTDLLEPSDTRTSCPYKGTASYYSVRVDGELYEDLVWYYPDPIPECPKIEGLLCFFNEKVDDIFVDGEPIEKVKTPWSGD